MLCSLARVVAAGFAGCTRDTLDQMRNSLKFAIAVAVIAFVSLILCGQRAASEGRPTPAPPATLSQLAQAPQEPLEDVVNPTGYEAGPEKKAAEKSPYAGWDTWCEPHTNEVACQQDSDCVGLDHPVGHPLRCLHPWWAKGNKELKICAPGYARRSERDWRHNRLREIVRQQYFDETEHCADDDRPIHKQHWRCQREWRNAERLTNFLWIPYKRETTARPWKRHRLNPDKVANEKAWVRQAGRYGWKVETACLNGKKRCKGGMRVVKASYPISENANPHYGEMWRWEYGLGGLGQNAALWTGGWDTMAPPEILCREVEQFETYLRRARQAVTDLSNGIDCDGDVKKDYWDKKPTWVVVHRAASGGKICPRNNASRKKFEDAFRRRAKSAGLDPDEVVTLEMLGKPIKKDTQNERAAEIYAQLEKKFPLP